MTKILLVEDDKSLREIYGVRLLAEGYDIVSAGDGEEALAMAIKERPQLIVSDVMMPKISGFDMLDILRSTTETKDIKVIMMTALSSDDQRARGEALGADRYLVKSQVGIEDVVRTVHEVLGDAPTSASTAAQTFGGPAPAATTRPAPGVVPPRPDAQQPAQPSTQSAPAPTPAAPRPAAPYTSGTSRAPAPGSAPASHGLPQPTAPFSTSRPANLGDRIIHPIAPNEQNQKQDISTLIAQELSQAPETTQPAPVALSEPTQSPMAPPLPPQPPVPPLPQAAPSTPTAPQIPSEPQSPTPVTPDEVPHPGANAISFEETPRQDAPSNPFASGPQPPTTRQ